MLKRADLNPSSDQVTKIPDLCDKSFETLLTNLVGDNTNKLSEVQIDKLKAVSPNPFYLTVICDELAKFSDTDEHIQKILDSLNESGESIHNLFKYFLNVWSEEHGKEFHKTNFTKLIFMMFGLKIGLMTLRSEWRAPTLHQHL